MPLVWLIYFSFAELLSLLPAQASSCILKSEEAQAENYSGDYACASMHEAIFRFAKFIWGEPGHDNVVAFGTVLIAVFTFVLYRSTEKLWLAGERQIDVAMTSARAAELSARAAIDAARAHLYVIVKQHNISDLISATAGTKFNDHVAAVKLTPILSYVFKNYGKTPATLEMPLHRLTLEAVGGGEYETFDRAIEIIDEGWETEPIAVSLTERPFYGRDAKALGDHDAFLRFFSDATYTDTFGRRHNVIHEFLYSAGRFHLVQRTETNHET
jgi:hypothetical protein